MARTQSHWPKEVMATELRHECWLMRMNCLACGVVNIARRTIMYGRIINHPTQQPTDGCDPLITGSSFIRAVALRICFGLVLAGLAIAAHKAQSEEGSFIPDLEILTIQPVRSDTDWLIPYRLNANLSLNRAADVASIDAGHGNTPRLHLVVAEPKKETTWSTNSRWKFTAGNGRTSLSPSLRFESKGEILEIKPRRHSFWVVWRKTFP
jgi:hypothetical protein